MGNADGFAVVGELVLIDVGAALGIAVGNLVVGKRVGDGVGRLVGLLVASSPYGTASLYWR